MPDARPRGPVAAAAGGVAVAVRVTPKAGRDEVRGLVADAHGRERVKVGVTAAPADGMANAAVVALLARTWRVPKSTVTISAGTTSRDKTVHVTGAADVSARIESWARAFK